MIRYQAGNIITRSFKNDEMEQKKSPIIQEEKKTKKITKLNK